MKYYQILDSLDNVHVARIPEHALKQAFQYLAQAWPRLHFRYAEAPIGPLTRRRTAKRPMNVGKGPILAYLVESATGVIVRVIRGTTGEGPNSVKHNAMIELAMMVPDLDTARKQYRLTTHRPEKIVYEYRAITEWPLWDNCKYAGHQIDAIPSNWLMRMMERKDRLDPNLVFAVEKELAERRELQESATACSSWDEDNNRDDLNHLRDFSLPEVLSRKTRITSEN